MAKAASKYISFDTAGNFVSEFADGPAVPEATEDGSLKSAVSYALDAIVEAGLYAPSAKNLQETKLVVVQDGDTIAQLERLNNQILGNETGHPFYGAPMLIAVLSDSSYPCWLQDGALVMGNLMNAAAALNVGSCWINRAMETFELPEGKALLAEWGLGENWKGVGNCILGYTDQAVLGDKARKEDRVLYV